MEQRLFLKQFETSVVLNQTAVTGVGEVFASVITGSRMLVTLDITSIDVGANVTINIDNTFSIDAPFETIETTSYNAIGRKKRILSDFNNQFRFTYNVTGGNATFKVAVSLFDNAITTRIDNATVSVDLSHLVDVEGDFDSVRIGDGTNQLEVNPDGSINISGTVALPTGAATEAKQDVGNASLSSILSSVDGLEAGQTTTNTLLADIGTNTDGIEAKLDSLNLNTDNIEASLTQIVNNTDGIETSLTQIANNTDAIETKLDDVVSAIQDQEPIKISGTVDGTPSGTEYVFVNNRRVQILAAVDRAQNITYADFGTKNQRIIEVAYSAPSIGVGAGFIAKKTITYTLVGTRYRRDDIEWTLV